jgi:DNA-binding Lrp family transcriptional regulator
MEERLNIGEDDLLRLLQQLANENSEGYSIDEYAEAVGRSREWVRRIIKRWMTDGHIVAGKRGVEDMIGRTCWLPVYRLKEGEHGDI